MPTTENVRFVGFVAGPVLTEVAVMLPSTARLFCQFIPAPDTVMLPAPVTALLNSLNLSPTTIAGPALLTVNVPVPEPVNAPVTDTTSFDCAGESDLFNRKNPFAFNVKLLAMFNVPIAVDEPPPIEPFVSTSTGLEIVPVPASTPALTVVVPEFVA